MTTKQFLKITAPVIITGALLAGCAVSNASQRNNSSAPTVTANALPGSLTAPEILAANNSYTALSTDQWNANDAIAIRLSGSTASSDSENVTVTESTVSITAAGVYRLTGSYSGQLIVNAAADSQIVLILDNANISTTAGAAIDIQQAGAVAIHLAENSDNSVADAHSYPESSTADAAISAASSLTISGSGKLAVQGNGGDGIVSTADLIVLGGSLTVTAADDGVAGKQALIIEGGELNITAGGDGLKSDQETAEAAGYIYISGGKITATAEADAVQAYTDFAITGGSLTVTAADDGIKSEVNAVIDGGTITVTDSVEALESFNIGINGGEINLTASDDAVNAAGDLSTLSYNTGTTSDSTADSDSTASSGGGDDVAGGQLFSMTGGSLTVNAEGDGIDSNGDIKISGGTLTINGTENPGNGALDASGLINITGGTVFATSGGGMEVPLSGSQGWIIANINVNPGEQIKITDDEGKTIGEFQAVKSATAISLSDPVLKNRQNYTVTLGSGESVTVNAGQLAGARSR